MCRVVRGLYCRCWARLVYFVVEQLVVASGKLATQRSPIVVLTLSLKDTDGTKRDVLLELSQSQLDDLLRDFANVNHVLGTISV